jgi:hypothetical protein
MAIDRPEAIGAASVFGPKRSGGCQAGNFLVLREEWAKPRGRKLNAGIAARRSRRSRRSARSGHHRDPMTRARHDRALQGERTSERAFPRNIRRSEVTSFASGPLFARKSKSARAETRRPSSPSVRHWRAGTIDRRRATRPRLCARPGRRSWLRHEPVTSGCALTSWSGRGPDLRVDPLPMPRRKAGHRPAAARR